MKNEWKKERRVFTNAQRALLMADMEAGTRMELPILPLSLFVKKHSNEILSNSMAIPIGIPSRFVHSFEILTSFSG